MNSRDELEKELDERIDQQQELIRSRFFALGSLLYSMNKDNELFIGRKLYEECLASEARLEEANEKNSAIIEFAKEYQDKCDSLKTLEDGIREIDSSLRTLKIRLGAIIYERSSLSLIDKETFAKSYEDVDRENALRKKLESRNPIDRLSAQNSLSKLQKNANDRYIQYVDDSIEKDTLDAVGGNNAPDVVAQIRENLTKRNELSLKASALKEWIDSKKPEYQRAKKDGLESAELYLTDMSNSWRESLIGYGNYLFDKGGVWINENTPSDVLDIIEEILALQKEYSELSSSKEKLRVEAKVDDYISMIEDNDRKILILEREKEKIDAEIASIQAQSKKLMTLVDQMKREI